eukprot:gene669-biopygen3158
MAGWCAGSPPWYLHSPARQVGQPLHTLLKERTAHTGVRDARLRGGSGQSPPLPPQPNCVARRFGWVPSRLPPIRDLQERQER